MLLSRRAFLKGSAAITTTLVSDLVVLRCDAEACSECRLLLLLGGVWYRGRHVVIEETQQTITVTIGACLRHTSRRTSRRRGRHHNPACLGSQITPRSRPVRALIDAEDAGLFILCPAYRFKGVIWGLEENS